MDRLRLVVGWTITVAWAVSFVTSEALPTRFQMPDGLSTLMGIVVGTLFAPSVLDLITKRRDGNHA